MKTLDEIKDEVQKEQTGHGFDEEWGGEFSRIVGIMDEAAKRYAIEVSKQALEDAADNARMQKSIKDPGIEEFLRSNNGEYITIDPGTITNTEIKLL